MNIFAYDRTFEGLLTLVYESYELKLLPDKLVGLKERNSYLFFNVHEVVTHENKAERVWNGLREKVSANSIQMLYHVYLSEVPASEMLVYKYIRKTFDTRHNIENDVSDPCVLDMLKIAQKVSRESHRIAMFVRFQKTADDIYYASFDPKYNVLPLTVRHFKHRFADQKWIVYDTKRKYGFYYDLKIVSEVQIENSRIDSATGKIDKEIMAEDEKIFQELWKNYYKTITIKERLNPKLHIKLLPKRFWKYLPEKEQTH
jgi:probable DNA metabolism protein